VTWLAFRSVPTRLLRFRLLGLMLMALSVFWEAGYFLYSVVTGEGDWAIAAQAAFGRGAWLRKPGGVVLGLVLYIVGIRATVVAAGSLVSGDHSAAGAVSGRSYLQSRQARRVWPLPHMRRTVWGPFARRPLRSGLASIPLWLVGDAHAPCRLANTGGARQASRLD
jgi:hypothetical protein